ncbi:hypothetical protein KRB99_000029 [Salmonella enterica]|nr:hypothetical protein [Salmonella enterica]
MIRGDYGVLTLAEVLAMVAENGYSTETVFDGVALDATAGYIFVNEGNSATVYKVTKCAGGYRQSSFNVS